MEKAIPININNTLKQLKKLNFIEIEKVKVGSNYEYIVCLKGMKKWAKVFDKHWLFQILFDTSENKYYATSFELFTKLSLKQIIQILNILNKNE